MVKSNREAVLVDISDGMVTLNSLVDVEVDEWNFGEGVGKLNSSFEGVGRNFDHAVGIFAEFNW